MLSNSTDPAFAKCECGYEFCWRCAQENHMPAACADTERWLQKNSTESENVRWILANTKKCPKCARPIEKNQGCNHMVCAKRSGGCGHEFCWLCLGAWESHGSETGGYYTCNLYTKQAEEGQYDEEEAQRMRAKHALAYYMHYFERFIVHDKALKMAETQRENLNQTVANFHAKESSVETVELDFLYDGLRQVAECRRTLKWTYVYGYYLPDTAGPKKALFEFLQRNLEEKTDELHELIERDLIGLFKPSDGGDLEGVGAREPMRKGKFDEFRGHVINFIRVTKDFRKKILDDLTDESKGLLVGEDAAMTVPGR